MSFIWITYIIQSSFSVIDPKKLIKLHLRAHLSLFIIWLVWVILSNALRDVQKVKWYFKKRFVFAMLILLAPLGLILLWWGSKFKKITKLILTVIFVFLFIWGQIYQQKKHDKTLQMTTFETIVKEVTNQKTKVFLKKYSPGALKGFMLKGVSRGGKTKLAVSDIYSRSYSGIVSITTKDAYGKEIGQGSGFIISKDGLIVTNFHVIKSAYQSEVKIGDKIFKEVFLVKGMPHLDIAILKIDAKDILPLPIGNSDNLTSGQFVVAIGNPLGLEQSVSSGIISAIRSAGSIKLIQITAPISPGSSGGPVFNEYGEVIGIATMASFFMAQNVNFAVPINYLKELISQK